MTDNPDLTLQQTDALWDAVAIPGPEQPTFVKQHERVCKVVAEMLQLATAPREDVPQPGYCPHCGRGDCAPTADAYEKQRQKAERAVAALDRVREVADIWFTEGEPGPTRAAGKHLLRILDKPGPAAPDRQEAP